MALQSVYYAGLVNAKQARGCTWLNHHVTASQWMASCMHDNQVVTVTDTHMFSKADDQAVDQGNLGRGGGP